MDIQIYLSPEVQTHFRIPQTQLQSDCSTPLHSNWQSLWRCDHLISTDDQLEHIFIFTNAVTRFSLILVDREQDLPALLNQFQQHFLLSLYEHGRPFPKTHKEPSFQFLSGSPSLLIEQMHLLSDIAIEQLIATDADIEATEESINQYSDLDQPVSPSEAMRARITPNTTTTNAAILPFELKTADL